MPKKSRNNKAKANGAANGALMQKMMQMMANMKVQPVASAPKRRRRARKANAVNNEGMITLTRRELLGTLKAEADGSYLGSFVLQPSTFKFLSNIGTSFERSRWLKMSFTYKPAVSVTSAGLVAMGVDWDGSKRAKLTREQVAAYTPSATFAVWQDTEKSPMVLPPARLQSRQWYVHGATAVQDSSPGTLVVVASGPVSADLGEIYVTYTVQMMGTKA